MGHVRHKFNAKPTVINNIRFGSKKEAKYYAELIIKKNAGEILFFLRQVPLDLPGGIRYVTDFVEFHADNSVHFVDVKGYKTREYIMKKKLVEEIYPFTLEEI